MNKKILAISVAGMLAVSSTVLAASASKQITVTPNQMKVVVDGKNITADNFVYKGTTYLPLRAVSEAVGGTVAYDDTTKTANITSKSTTASSEMTKNATTAIVYHDLMKESDELVGLIYRFYHATYECRNLDSDEDRIKIINDWQKNIPSVETDIIAEAIKIEKYEATDSFYKTSLKVADDMSANYKKTIDLFKQLYDKRMTYEKCDTKENFNATDAIYTQIYNSCKPFYSQCKTQHDIYLTRITE